MTAIETMVVSVGAGIGAGALLGAAHRSDGLSLFIRGLCKLHNGLRRGRPWPADFETLTDLQIQLDTAGWSKLSYLLGCPYCLGVYLSLAVNAVVQNCTQNGRLWLAAWLTVYGVMIVTYLRTEGYDQDNGS